MHSHDHQHELLYVHCGSCGSASMTVMIMEGVILFDCAECGAEVGAMEDIEQDSKLLLSRGCQGH